jgi:predicted permease
MRREQAMQPVLTSAECGVSTLSRQFSGAVAAVMGGVAALLLLVCGNLGGLMLARAESHTREVAIRLSLGASRWSILRRTLTEAVLLSCAGATAGLWMARSCGPWLLGFLPARRPLGIDLVPDLRVGAFAAAICVLSAASMSIFPAVHIFREDLGGVMGRQSGRASHPRLRLVAFQVGLATLLMTGGFALVRTLHAIQVQDPGFRRENLVIMTLNPRMAGVKPASIPAVFDEVMRRARALPGVEAVSLAQRALMRGIGFKGTAGRAGSRIAFADLPNVSLNGVSLDHFANLRMRITRGRPFEAADNRGKPRPAIVSESFARQFYPGMDPIGQTFGMGGIGAVILPDRRIVGVVNDTKYRSMREIPPPTVYGLLNDDAFSFEGMVLHVSVRGNPASTIATLTGMLRGVGPGLAPTDVATMEQEIDTSLWQERLLAALSSILALVSTVLAGLGLFGMLAYSVSRRDPRDRHPRRRRRFRRTNRQDDWAGCCLSRSVWPRARSGRLRCVLARGGGVALRRHAVGCYVDRGRRGLPDRRCRLRYVVPGRARRGDPAVAGVTGRIKRLPKPGETRGQTERFPVLSKRALRLAQVGGRSPG